ncbi:glycosyltransferase family 25 protein [Roseomonas sp. GCM10028921]
MQASQNGLIQPISSIGPITSAAGIGALSDWEKDRIRTMPVSDHHPEPLPPQVAHRGALRTHHPHTPDTIGGTFVSDQGSACGRNTCTEREIEHHEVVVRVISLAGSERRNSMASQLDPLNIEWSFFDACTEAPTDIPYECERSRTVHGRELTRGELGCFASHRALWRWFADETCYGMMVVLEDDLIIDPVFFRRLDHIAAYVRKVDYLRLYAKVPAEVRLECALLDRHVAVFGGRAYGTQAYILTKQGAKTFLNSIKQVERPIDDEMDRFWKHKLLIRSVFPFPVMEIDYGSTIEPKRRQAEPMTKLRRLRWEAFKAIEKLRRHWAVVTMRRPSP